MRFLRSAAAFVVIGGSSLACSSTPGAAPCQPGLGFTQSTPMNQTDPCIVDLTNGSFRASYSLVAPVGANAGTVSCVVLEGPTLTTCFRSTSGIEVTSVHDDVSKLQAYLHVESAHDYPYVLTITCGGTVIRSGTENMCTRAL